MELIDGGDLCAGPVEKAFARHWLRVLEGRLLPDQGILHEAGLLGFAGVHPGAGFHDRQPAVRRLVFGF